MKTFVWLLTVGILILSTTCWAITRLVAFSLSMSHGSLPLPDLSEWVFLLHSYMPWFPVPWLAYAVYVSLYGELSTSAALRFAGTIFVASTLLVGVVAIACVLPYSVLIDG